MASELFSGGGGGIWDRYRATNQPAGIVQGGNCDPGFALRISSHESAVASAIAADVFVGAAKNEASRANNAAELLLLLEDV